MAPITTLDKGRFWRITMIEYNEYITFIEYWITIKNHYLCGKNSSYYVMPISSRLKGIFLFVSRDPMKKYEVTSIKEVF